jgi:hypothetical protein
MCEVVGPAAWRREVGGRRPSGWRREVGGPAAGGVKLAAGRPSGQRPNILMLQKCYLNNKTTFNEVLKTFLSI